MLACNIIVLFSMQYFSGSEHLQYNWHACQVKIVKNVFKGLCGNLKIEIWHLQKYATQYVKSCYFIYFDIFNFTSRLERVSYVVSNYLDNTSLSLAHSPCVSTWWNVLTILIVYFVGSLMVNIFETNFIQNKDRLTF